MTPASDKEPFLVGNRIWLFIAAGVAITVVTIVVLVWWDQRALDRECDKLDRQVVTNQQEADELFDDKAAAGCLDRE